MPGNGVGDRVHNFFAQDNLSQGPRSQVGDGNWPLNDSLWVGNQKQFGVSDSSPRNYNSQQSEHERGHGSQRVADPHLFNISQTNANANARPNSNGYMYGRQTFQTRPDEANFMGVDTDFNRNNVNQRGFPFYESQQEPVPEEPPKNLFRSEPSEAHNSFDLFGGQQHQMNSQYPGMVQPLQQQHHHHQQQQQQQQQQSGFGDIQQLQQQLMLRKMQELQRQELQRQELQRQEQLQRQEELQRQQQNSLNQASAFARQASGSHSHGIVNGNPNSDSSGYAWGELASGNNNTNTNTNANWLQRASPAMQGSSSGLAFSPEPGPGPGQGQPQRSTGFVHQQQVDQSLYGVPVSTSRGPLNQYPHMATDKGSIQQMPNFNNSFPGNHYGGPPEQLMVHMQDGGSVGRQGLPSKSLFGNTSGQGSNSQQLKPPQNTSMDLLTAPEIAQDKSTSAASLDPDEEKILFGSDDNIWEAFGTSKNMGGGVSSLLDDNEFASGLPSSLQSGSWSALMQSAVAEVSSGDGDGGGGGGGGGVGLQEEWPDLNFQNPEIPPKQPSTLNSRSVAEGGNMSDKQRSNLGFQHHDERQNINYPKQMNQNPSGGSNWLNRGALQTQKAEVEESRLRENINAKGMPGHWTAQQHPNNNKQNNLNSGFNINQNNNLSQQSQSNTPAIPNLSNLQGVNSSNQFSPNNNHLNYWKHVDSSVKSKGSENSDKSQRRLNKGPQMSESSFNSSDKEDLKMHEMESSSRRENSNDSYRSGSSHVPNTVVQREKFSSDGGDSRSLAAKQQSLSNQTSRMNSGPRKFQYHPMGNLDDDVGVPYGARQGVNPKAMSLQHPRGLGGQEQGTFGHSRTSGQGYAPELEGVPKGSDDTRFKGMIPGHVPNIFASHDRSAGLSTSDKASQPSQNMLELLHKVDQSRDRGVQRQLNSFDRNLSSEIPEPENSDGSFGGHQRTQSSNSQGIGLQLGPPSQRIPLSNHASPRAMQNVKPNNPLSQAQAVANSRGKAPFQETPHGEFKNDRMSSVSGQSASETAGHKMMNNFSTALNPDFSSRSQLQIANRSANESFNGHTPQIRQSDETRGRSLNSGLYDNAASSEKVQPLQPRGSSGVPQQSGFPKMLPNQWPNLSPQQMFAATQAQAQAQARKGQSSLSPSPSHPLNIVESASLGQQNSEEQEAEKRRSNLSKFGGNSLNSQGVKVEQSVKESSSSERVDRGQPMNGSVVNDSVNLPFADSSSLNPSAAQKDLEAFGRSLKPNNLHQQYALLNQMKAMKSTENDPNNRVLKKLKDSDNILIGQQGQQVAPNKDSETPIDKNIASLPANPPSNNAPAPAPASDHHGPQIEHTRISPQMAPSWFDQYGTFKSGQVAQRSDGVTVKTLEQPVNIVKVSSNLETRESKEQASGVADRTVMSQPGVIWNTAVQPPVAVEQLTSPPHTNIGVQKLVALKSKKRKYPAAEPHPWLKEVSGAVKNLQAVCAASMEWCGATNRLMEKVDDDGVVIEDAVHVPKPKKRIILTNQLMQHLFPPPPATLLSTDATSSYESVAFHAARLSLGDVCNLVSNSGSNALSDKSTESEKEKTDDQRLSEVVEDCESKASRLESEFSRLDKRASILDLRVECQDLEKFSIINRFAKFHGRGQESSEASSSSSDAPANIPKPFPQRYVIAVQLPKNLPEKVQCLSL